MCQNGSPKGDQNPSKIIKKSSLSRRGLPQATSDLPAGTPPQKGRKSTEFCTNFGRNFGRVQLLIVPPKLKKKWRALRPVFVALGGASPQAEYWVLALTPKLQKQKWRALPPVFLALGGASPQAEYWLRNDAMPDASQNKKRCALCCTPGLVYCTCVKAFPTSVPMTVHDIWRVST